MGDEDHRHAGFLLHALQFGAHFEAQAGVEDADEQPGAAPVVVLGYDAWQALLEGDPDPLGRTVQLAGTTTTVVGVMPEGYGFPESQNAWMPLQVEASEIRPESAPRLALFARLAPGATLESARAELEAAGRAAAADFPALYGTLEPRVVGFAARGSATAVLLLLSTVRLLFIFLLVVICANVATLVFARTVTREGEIAVRTSLGEPVRLAPPVENNIVTVLLCSFWRPPEGPIRQ